MALETDDIYATKYDDTVRITYMLKKTNSSMTMFLAAKVPLSV